MNPSALHKFKFDLVDKVDPRQLAILHRYRRTGGVKRGVSLGQTQEGGGAGSGSGGGLEDVRGRDRSGSSARRGGSVTSRRMGQLDSHPSYHAPATSLKFASTDELVEYEAAARGTIYSSPQEAMLATAQPNPSLGGVPFVHSRTGHVVAVPPPPNKDSGFVPDRTIGAGSPQVWRSRQQDQRRLTVPVPVPAKEEQRTSYQDFYVKHSALKVRGHRHCPLSAATAGATHLGAPAGPSGEGTGRDQPQNTRGAPGQRRPPTKWELDRYVTSNDVAYRLGFGIGVPLKSSTNGGRRPNSARHHRCTPSDQTQYGDDIWRTTSQLDYRCDWNEAPKDAKLDQQQQQHESPAVRVGGEVSATAQQGQLVDYYYGKGCKPTRIEGGAGLVPGVGFAGTTLTPSPPRAGARHSPFAIQLKGEGTSEEVNAKSPASDRPNARQQHIPVGIGNSSIHAQIVLRRRGIH